MATMRSIQDLNKQKFNDEGYITKTSDEQIETEQSVKAVYETFHSRSKLDKKLPRLNRNEHWNYLRQSLCYLPRLYECLDASRAWLCYWSIQSLSLLQVDQKHDFQHMIKFLARCQHPNGGFGGGPGQYPHLATTYAAVNALCIIGTDEAFAVINRKTLREFLWTLRSPEGSFIMHKDGEDDIRGVYCALAIATLTNVACDNLFKGTAEWVISCQTYEGGFSGCPGMEAHGGYTFCGLAALFLLEKAHLCDAQGLLRWVANKQMKLEGGFQGRTNKLVDGCYSFWQTSAFALIHELLIRENKPPKNFLFNQTALQEYILICCQYKSGGLIDKPTKQSDLYHTCYTLSGLSIAQMNMDGTSLILGPEINKVQQTHLVYNINPLSVIKAKSYFKIGVDELDEEGDAEKTCFL